MAQTEILSSVIRTGSYPVSTQVSAPSHCGTLILSLGSTPWTDQMIHELPTINIQIFTLAGEKYASFDIDMSTVNEDVNPLEPAKPYFIAIYDIPEEFNFKVTPLFDNTALVAHNNAIENGIVNSLDTSNIGIVDNDNDSESWTVETTTFPITITFDDTSISSSGGDGKNTIYRISPGTLNSADATDEIIFEKSEDKGATWQVLSSGSADPADPPGDVTFSLGLFETSGQGETGKIKSALLPSYVDDVINGYKAGSDFYPDDTPIVIGYYYNGNFYSDSAHTSLITGESNTLYYDNTSGASTLWYTYSSGSYSYTTAPTPVTPASGIIYVDLATNHSYRWSGVEYIDISNPLDKETLYTLMETTPDGNYDATHHGMVPANTGGSASTVLRGNGWDTVTDNSTATALSNSSTKLITERSVALGGYAKSLDYTNSSGTTTNIAADANGVIDFTDLNIMFIPD